VEVIAFEYVCMLVVEICCEQSFVDLVVQQVETIIFT
jgi:hypothetical protein